jgi:uridine phosphorylase
LIVTSTWISDNPVPLLEYDDEPLAYVEPSRVVPARDVPRVAVLCFFAEVLAGLADDPAARPLGQLDFAHGAHPIWEVGTPGGPVAVVHPGVGAPLAAAALEEMIALGCRAFVACGGAGALTGTLDLGDLVVVDSALRDEGTSYHYLPPARTVASPPAVVEALTTQLTAAGLPHTVGRTWTTDAFYRETKSRVARRVAEGCLTVEMEAAALLAVAAFRGAPLGYVLYAGDTLAGEEWDERAWSEQYTVRRRLFEAAAAAAVTLA